MPKRSLIFAPAAFNLAETTRMIEIAKGIAAHEAASKVFEIHFISGGGEFKCLIEAEGFPLQRLELQLTKEKIEHIARVDRGERLARAFSEDELVERANNETALASPRDELHDCAGQFSAVGYVELIERPLPAVSIKPCHQIAFALYVLGESRQVFLKLPNQ
jgi:hypothetical protein